MTRDELLWLVKSSGRILGPYPTPKVAELLRTREISVLDEISPPLRRWQTLQYHDEFRDVVDSLRKASLSERTEVTWSPGTNGLTQTVTDVMSGELTQDLANEAAEDFVDSRSREIVLHDVAEQTTTAKPTALGRYQPPHAQNTAIERQVEKTTRGLWIVTGLILIAALAFIAQRKYAGGAFDAKPTVVNIRQNVVAQVQIGHYAEALKILKNYYADPMQSGEMAIYYGSLLIHLENQTVLGRRLLNSVLGAQRGESKQALTGLALADLVDGQLDAADEGFSKALNADPEYVPALVDQAAVAFQKNDFPRTRQMAQHALQASPLQGEALLLLMAAQIELFRADANAAHLEAAQQKIADYRAHSWDFVNELGLYDLYAAELLHSPKFDDKVQAWLDLDPTLTSAHRHNVFIYRGGVTAKTTATVCDQVVRQLGETPRASAVEAACATRQGRFDAARAAIDKAVRQSPKDPLLQAWFSHVLRESGDNDQAGVVLGRATELNRRGQFALPTLMQARFCQVAGLIECARDNWKNLFERDMDYLPAVAGQAWVNAQMKSNLEAGKMISRGLKLSPDYIPLLELKARGENEGWYAGN